MSTVEERLTAIEAFDKLVDQALWGSPIPTPDPAPTPSGDIGPDGVIELVKTKVGSPSFHLLPATDMNNDPLITQDNSSVPLKKNADGSWHFSAGDVSYKSGGNGKTIRCNILASGGKGKHQVNTWKTSTPPPAFLFNDKDITNYEFSAIVQVNGPVDPKQFKPHYEMSFKSGAIHSGSSDPRASCVEMSLAVDQGSFGPPNPRFARELNHPNYDYVPVKTQHSSFKMKAGQKFGVKHIVYPLGSNKTIYHLVLIDDDPFLPEGGLSNNYLAHSEYWDVMGVNTGKYRQNAFWGSFQNTLRCDGYMSLDLYKLNIREIIVPAGPLPVK